MPKVAEMMADDMPVRSLLMRLYHSRWLGEDFYPPGAVNGEAADLEARGWIERHGQGWRITEQGVTEWAYLNYGCLTSDQAHYQGDLYKECRELLQEEALYMGLTCKKDGCDQARAVSVTGKELTYCREHQQAYWNEKAAIREAKKRAEREAGGEEIRGRGRPKGSKKDVSKPKPRTRMITSANATAQPLPTLLDVYTPPETTNEWIHAPLPDGYPVAAEHDCDDCIYKDVVDLLIDRVPGVREIVTGLQQVRGT